MLQKLISISFLMMETLILLIVLLVFYRNLRQFFNSKYMYFIIATEIPVEEMSLSVSHAIVI